MNSIPQPTSPDADSTDLEATVDEVIALCGGDPRAAVRAPLVANTHLERELALTIPAVSYGYSRGWHRKKQTNNGVAALDYFTGSKAQRLYGARGSTALRQDTADTVNLKIKDAVAISGIVGTRRIPINSLEGPGGGLSPVGGRCTMTTFQEYARRLPEGHTYALAIPEASYSPYQGDLTDAKDFYLYSIAVEDREINNIAEAWPDSDGEDNIYLLPAALSYLAAAAKEGGHMIIDVAVPGWTSIAYESLPFLYINNDKMMLRRQPSGRIQLAVGGHEGGVFDLSLDLRSGDSEVGKSGIFRITGSMVIRNYTYLEQQFIHQIVIQRSFTEKVDQIFVAEVFGKAKSGEKLLGANSAMRQVLAYLADKWDHGHKERGYNIAAALADETKEGVLELALFVLNEKKRSRIAHAETRVVSFMNVVCREGNWKEKSAVVKYIAKLTELKAKEILEVRARFIKNDDDGSKLVFFSSFQPCYMCRAEPDGATLDKIIAVNGTAVMPGGRTLRSSFGGKYLDRMETIYYFDMDANVFYPRVVEDAISGEQGPVQSVSLVQTSTDGFVSPEGKPIFGPTAIGNAKEDYGTYVAYERIKDSSFLEKVDPHDGGLLLQLTKEEGLDYGGLLPPPRQKQVGMWMTLARSGLTQAELDGAVPDNSATGKTGVHSQGMLLSGEQLAALRRVAALLYTLR